MMAARLDDVLRGHLDEQRGVTRHKNGAELTRRHRRCLPRGLGQHRPDDRIRIE